MHDDDPRVITRGRLTRYSEALTRPRRATNDPMWHDLVVDTLDFATWMRLVAVSRDLGHTWDADTLAALRDAHCVLAQQGGAA